MVTEFAAAITDGRPALTDGYAGLRVLAVLEAASESQRRAGAMAPVGMPMGRHTGASRVAMVSGGTW
jgi:hypothetical protein